MVSNLPRARSKLPCMELLTIAVAARANAERAIWLAARHALDAGQEPADVAHECGVSVTTLYRRLREHELTYGRGRLSSGG